MATLDRPVSDGADDIYNTVVECAALFQSLAERTKPDHDKRDAGEEETDPEERRRTPEDKISGSRWRTDEMERSFNLWIDYTGALAADISRSLDTRLRAHRDIKEMVIELLQMLARNLEYRRSHGAKLHLTSGDGGDGDDGDGAELGDEARDASQKALEELHFMASAIRRSSVRSHRYNLSSQIQRDDDSYFQEQACLLVRYFFPHARRSLCDQLGVSLAIRRTKFFQRMRHEEKLRTRQQSEEPKREVKPTEAPIARPQLLDLQATERYPANLPRPAVPLKARPGSADTGSRLDSVAARHHLRRGPALSTVSMGSSIRLSSAAYPDKPKFADDDKDCACPYCARRLMTNRLKNETKYWQNHMDEDTEPYVCLSEQCTSPMLFFVHMKDWIGHMETFHSSQWNRTIHMSTWYCDIGHKPAIQFNDRSSFVRHMKDRTNHGGREPPTDLQLDTLSRNKHEVLVRDDEYCCPICECVPDTLKPVIGTDAPQKIRSVLYEHVAAHIKDLAFKSVPALDQAEAEGDGKSQVEDGDRRQLKGNDSTASYPSGLEGLRQETNLDFYDDLDGDTFGAEDEPHNEDFSGLGGLPSLWDNPEFVEYWEQKTTQDIAKPDIILDQLAQGQQEKLRTSNYSAMNLDDNAQRLRQSGLGLGNTPLDQM
ncbi:hypothetical protein S40293_10227, partial [Stachybotrys chartarum IBT 40293]